MNQEQNQKFNLSKPQILLLEDNQINTNMIKYAFEQYNVDIKTVIDYRNLIQISQTNNFDLIFIDSNIQSLNALNIAQNFRNNEKTKHIPIIAMISNTNNIPIEKIEESFNDSIKKPIGKNKLGQMLKKLLPGHDIILKKDNVFVKNHSILLFKKTQIENKIFAGALGVFEKDLTIANTYKEFMDFVKNKTYGLILIDSTVEGFNISEIMEKIDFLRAYFRVDTKLFIFSSQTQDIESKKYIKIISPSISKTQLVNIIKQEMQNKEC